MKNHQVMQSVKINNEELEHHGQAGYVVGPGVEDPDKIAVKIDVDSTVYEFDAADVITL